MLRSSLIALATLVALPTAAHAAAPAGSYKGTSSGKYIQIGSADEPTDKGKVSFTVKKNKVRDFKLRKQLIQCGPPAEVPVDVAVIKLNSAGKGSATFEDPAIGALKVSITVKDSGKASGTIKAQAGASLCDPDYPVKFTAKKS